MCSRSRGGCHHLILGWICLQVAIVGAVVADDFEEIILNEIDPGDQHQYVGNNNGGDFQELTGGPVVGERIIRTSDMPYLLRIDLDIEKGGRLIVEPGVTIYFAPMVGITVRGSIKAVGNAEQKILFSTQPNSGYDDRNLPEPKELGARLVDGPTPLEGRLQLFHLSKWRSVCTNSRNWTISDYETVCRQMGFRGGRFWNWVDRAPNFEARLLYEEPACRGIETSIVECAWTTRQIGSGMCDYHSDIGVQCMAQHDHSLSHWRGIRFENAPTERKLSQDNTIYEAMSMSELRHVEIVRAGSGRNRQATSAIEVIGVPPALEHVAVLHAAYTGINVTRPDSAFTFRKVDVSRSRGIGIFVNSSVGMAHLEECSARDNGADGVYYVGHDLRADERYDRSSIHDFCTLPTTAGQTYPISLSLQQSPYAAAAKECGKYFFTRPGYVLTLNFVDFIVTKNETASIEVFDGTSASDRQLGSWSVRNSTRPQSIASTRDKIFIRFRADARVSVLGFIRISTGVFKAFDLNVTRSVVKDNGGRGIAVSNMRSSIHVHDSSVFNNGHLAGVHVQSGAGDVNITDSRIGFNQGDGVNITYYGGNRNISRSSVASNNGYGVAVWLNATADDRREFVSFNQTTTVEYSEVIHNLETGILHGNYCGNMWINVTGNLFNDSQSNGIDIQTCWLPLGDNRPLRLQIGHNAFEHNHKIGIVISPALNLDARIEFNHFKQGKYGALLVRNEPLEEFRALEARLIVQHNTFYDNRGVYVASLGLSPHVDRGRQWLLFTRNFVRENKIDEPFGMADNEGEGMAGERRLRPRSRVAAPIVITSSNVDVFRNIISNRDSRYEVGSQFSDQSQILNVTYNWLGHSDEDHIFGRLFHRKDRYDLAKIEYLPYLLHNSNPAANVIISNPTFVPRFYTDGSDRIGGEVDGQEILPPGTYTVDRDINVRPGGKLTIQSGVTLNFGPNVGIMVAGKLEARGKRPDDILFTLKREPVMIATRHNSSEDLMSDAEMVDTDTEAVPDVDEQPTIPVRLLGGKSEHEGRLQIYVNGRWGTVCDYGWTVIDAALACHQLGLALNPEDWRLLRSEVPGAGTTEDIVASNVRCTEHDIDISKCRSEWASRGEFEHSCTHDNDVGLRCYEGAWAGLRFGVLAERADLQYVTVEKAGLFDYATNTFKPAMQMDLARHNLDNVRIVQNLHDGLGVIYADVFGGASINNVKNSEFSENRGNGISLKQLGLRVYATLIHDNLGAGISHDPVVSAIEQREIASWFQMAPDFNVEDSDYRPVMLPQDSNPIELEAGRSRHIVTAKVHGDPIERTINVRCQPGYVIGIQLLNPIENRSTEDLWFHNSPQNGHNRSEVWQVKRDVSVFPATSSSYGIVLHYKSGSAALGGTVLMLTSIPAPVQDIRNKIVRGPVPTLHVSGSKIQRNARGLSATYYNRYLGERGEHYLRKANESMRIVGSEITRNTAEAVLIHAPFWDVHTSNISEVSVHINGTLIADNGRGIRQISKDLRSSNNLFHYVLQDTTVERNNFGGFEITLPYVWQYDENFTHSVYLGNVTWSGNKRFGIVIDGHYAAVNITGNRLSENECLVGLVAMRGMEKRLRIDNNRLTANTGRFMFEFSADSQSEIVGEVHALLTLNEIKENRYEVSGSFHRGAIAPKFNRGRWDGPEDPTRVIGFRGVQKVRVYRNLIANNRMDYDLVAGVRSARLKNFLDASENWWGTTEAENIDQRIFDFDDWNNHAETIFRPFLLEDNFDASISVAFGTPRPVDLNRLGGRIYEDLSLWRRDLPYIVRADITIMPDVTLTINPGVEMEFAPNVGILALGTLVARGARDAEIVMRPIANAKAELNRVERRSLERLIVHDSIRLCTGRNCSSDENEVDRLSQGFVEYFNHTTMQWVPICDHRFTERNAQVVCRELGFDPLDVFFGHDRRIEFHTNSLTRIWSWVEPLECRGDEHRLSECPERLNGQLYGRRHECRWDSHYVFVSCNRPQTAEKTQYWGGIRFSGPDFEQNLYEHRIHDTHTHNTGQRHESRMEFVRVESAGLLHGEKSPAVQTIFKNPSISFVKIRNSAHHGLNLVSPSDAIHLQFVKIENAFGTGINAISLTGEGRESDESSFTPIKALDLPYGLFSMIDICDTTKEVTIEERVLVYYKYDNNPVNCVKIFNSAYRVKPLGLRLLQANLFNHSKEYGRRDALHLWDGDIYNITAQHIGSVEANSDNEKRLFRTKGPSLSVRLIASGAPAGHGFIAEVITLPISAIGFNRDAQHNITNSDISGATTGAITYHTAGEVSPALTIERNRFANNCRQLYGNFSTCEASIKIDVQNMHSFYFRNNLIKENQGGLSIRADSRSSATSLRGWIHHNLFVRNKNRPSMYVEGRQSSPYQEVIIYKNYISQNDAKYDDVIVLKQVVSNFTYNYVHSNRGGRIVEISGFDKVRLPIYQTTSHNGFYDNVATDWRGRATIVAGTAGQHYVDNIFVNPENDFEMIAVNRSIFDFQYWNSTVDVWKTKIDAAHNYWNYNETLTVGSRIRDRSDDPLLLEVQYSPFHMNNQTVLDGKCPPGWSLHIDTCYIYVGAPMTFHEARDFCRSDNASIPYITSDSTALWLFLQRQMSHLRWVERVWIQDLNYIDQCTTFMYRSVEVDECDSLHGFICEIDPKVVIDPLSWQADFATLGWISAFFLAIILLFLVACCWYSKSKHRHVERLQRRNSIRQSLRSLNSIDGGGQGSIRRRNFNMNRSTDTLTKSTATDYKKMMSNGSIDSMEKSALSSETSYDMYDPANGHNSQSGVAHNSTTSGYNELLNPKFAEYASKTVAATVAQRPKIYGLPDYSAANSNGAETGANSNAASGFELAYRNEGFRDNSTVSGTRQNSMSTMVNDDTPIIHQIDTDEGGSDYYGNSSTLPMRGRIGGDHLSFLSELKHRLPEYEPLPKQGATHSSFLPPPPPPPLHESTVSLTFAQKIDQLNFTPTDPDSTQPEIRRTGNANTIPHGDPRRPDSYYTAMRTTRDSVQPLPPAPHRPRTVYEAADESDRRATYARSKSEAMLETNFDEEGTLNADSRSYSQPLETAM